MRCVCTADWPTSTQVLLGENALAVVSGERHLKMRKMQKPAFSMSAINVVIPRMADIAQRSCDKWASKGRVKGKICAKEFTFAVS